MIILEEEKETRLSARIKVIGVGGAGGNAVNSMIESQELECVDYMIANTDAQALESSPAPTRIQLGSKATKGLGAGANPDIGRRAAEENVDHLVEHIKDADILFLAAGLGGGTGSGALPVIAEVARELGILTVSVVTKPFAFEGKRRNSIAEAAVSELKKIVDTLLIVPNQRLLEISDARISMLNAFALSNDVLKQAIKGISDIITKPGHINVDFADVRAIMKDMGMALMGTGKASGESRAIEAARKAISSPLLENLSISGAKGVLINISGNTDLGLYEINEAASLVYDLVNENANIILGSVIDSSMGDELMVTVIATGFEEQQKVDTSQKVTERHVNQTANFISAAKKAELIEHEIESQKAQEQKTNTIEARAEQKVETKASFEFDDLDTPTYLRKQQEAKQSENQHEQNQDPRHQNEAKSHSNEREQS